MASEVVDAAQPAPRWRKWLALRVLALNVLTLVLAAWVLGAADEAKLDLPKWLDIVVGLPFIAAFFGLIANLALGVTDMVVHLVPAGRARNLLLQGDRTPEQIAKEFEETGYIYALSPFFVVAGLLVVALLCILAFGGVSALGTLASAVSSWPSWAVVITILLVLILLKKR